VVVDWGCVDWSVVVDEGGADWSAGAGGIEMDVSGAGDAGVASAGAIGDAGSVAGVWFAGSVAGSLCDCACIGGAFSVDCAVAKPTPATNAVAASAVRVFCIGDMA
jgi:hypothetical protein